MDKNVSPSRQQDDVLMKLTQDIMKGAKIRLVEPVVAENRRLAEMLQALQKQEKDEFAHIKVRLDLLEQSVQQIPVLILAAISDAINQAGVDVRS